MGQVTVSAIYDGRGNFTPQGKTFCISTAATVFPDRKLPTSYYASNSAPPPTFANLLAVKTIEFGELFLNMTLTEYTNLVRTADSTYIGSNQLFQATLVGGTIFIENPQVTSASQIIVYGVGCGGTISVVITEGVGYRINSTNPADTCSVDLSIIKY